MYVHYLVVSLRNHCCHGNAIIYSLFTAVDVDVAVNNIKRFSVVMEIQQLVPFILLSSYKIVRFAVNNKY